jgi:uncharacterized protein with HEPN domain
MKDNEYIERLLKYCKKITEYIKPVQSFDDFISNSEKVDAVILNLEQIGETAKKISVNTKNKYSDVNWPSIVGLRNMISHEYEGIELEIIYEIALNHINKLYIQLTENKII